MPRQAGRGRGARPSDAHRRAGLDRQALQAACRSRGRRPRAPAAGIPIQASIPGGLPSTPSLPRASPPDELNAEIGCVIEELRENGVTQEELDRARNSYLAEFVYTSDSQSRMARHYGLAVALGMSVADVDEWPDRLPTVTVEDVRNVARKYPRRQEFRHRHSRPVPETTSSIVPAKAKNG